MENIRIDVRLGRIRKENWIKGGTGPILREENKHTRSGKGKMWLIGRRKAMERSGNRYAT